ncbi:hypothetical protein BJ742DRAFT_820106 [Cladochytrium replicatum]|nr:hypothetical protein BJ742DRAFT_820106 [Cladochytrium replicatum]
MEEWSEVHKIRVCRYSDGQMHYLHFQQLLVYGPDSDENLALQKPCYISSFYHSTMFPASNGNNGKHFLYNFCHSGEEECPYWEVTVDAVVQRVELWNRGDMCQYRLEGFVIQGIDKSGRVLWVVGPLTSAEQFEFTVPPSAPSQCMPRHGRMTGGPGGVFETHVSQSRISKMEVWSGGGGFSISTIRLTWANGDSVVKGQTIDGSADFGTRNEVEFGEDEKVLEYHQSADTRGSISYIWIKTTQKTWCCGSLTDGTPLDYWETVGSGVPIGARFRSNIGIDAFGLLFSKPANVSDIIYPEIPNQNEEIAKQINAYEKSSEANESVDTQEYHHVHKIRVCREPDGKKYFLNFQQLLAYEPNSDINVALGKPSTISSVYEFVLTPAFRIRFGASKGNNGVYETVNFCRTKQEENPFWEVTIDAVVSRVVMFNRQDMDREWLKGFVIRGLDSAETVLWELGPLTEDRRFEFTVPPKV